MKRFIISGTFFHAFRDDFIKILPALFSGATAHTTILDCKTLSSSMTNLRQISEKSAIPSIFVTVTGDMEEDAPDIMKSLTKVKSKSAVDVILDCTVCSLDYVNALLSKIKYDISILSTHISTFSLVCNDAEMLEFANCISVFFRIAPLNYSDQQLQDVYKRIRHGAWRIRYVEGSRLMRFLDKLHNKLKRKR